ncbi:MAG: germination protein YpeB, partial [Clostridia bacterium]|nr:germination protein YpeB [Clostridia bacterium]
SKFLAQAGDYAAYLSRKVIQNETVTAEEYENLSDLSEYAEAVNQEFSKLEDKIYENSMSIESIKVSTPFVAYADGESFTDGMQRMETLPQEYPSLIYDGPFSEHLEDAESEFLNSKQTVSKRTAESVVKLFLGEERAKKVAYESDGSGTLDTYLFSGNTENGNIAIEVTKEGGMVLWMLDAREVKETQLQIEQAMTAGALFLSQRGFPSMKSSYYDVADNVATINYAYQQDGVTMYSDLIKVKIALDNGEVLGFEAQGYLMCHREREIPETALREEEARQKVEAHLAVKNVSMAYIPLESKREVFCYELSGTLGKNDFLIYVNAQTGGIEKILMLQKSENGVLTI